MSSPATTSLHEKGISSFPTNQSIDANPISDNPGLSQLCSSPSITSGMLEVVKENIIPVDQLSRNCTTLTNVDLGYGTLAEEKVSRSWQMSPVSSLETSPVDVFGQGNFIDS